MRGERGEGGGDESHPSRGAWIEISGLRARTATGSRRTPHGVRGLKYEVVAEPHPCRTSHPSRGAWIEIGTAPRGSPTRPGRTPHGVRGLK